jgi:archaellum component FlaF (FlaF/FlaG flagellin family)
MAKLDNPQRIVLEDFEDDQRAMAEKIANVLNPFMENVFNILNKNVDLANLKMEVVSFKVRTNASGTPNKTTQFSSTNFANTSNGYVVYTKNLTNSTIYPTTAPFVSFVPQGGNIYKVVNVTGLTVNDEYEVRLLLIP